MLIKYFNFGAYAMEYFIHSTQFQVNPSLCIHSATETIFLGLFHRTNEMGEMYALGQLFIYLVHFFSCQLLKFSPNDVINVYESLHIRCFCVALCVSTKATLHEFNTKQVGKKFIFRC